MQTLFLLFTVLFLSTVSYSLTTDNRNLSKQPGGWLEQEQSSTSQNYSHSPVIDEPSINQPDAETVWEHGQTRVRIEWDGLDGSLVKGSLLKNGSLVGNILDWQENSESAVISEVLSSWGSGSSYQIRLEDNLGNFLLSDEFRIMAPINITEPTFGTTWAHSQTGVPIRWSGAQGSTVTIELLKAGSRVATLAENIPNTGEYIYNQPIYQDWGSGDSYHVRIKDNIGNVYDSRIFTLNSIYVVLPDSSTLWSDQTPLLNLSWSGGSRVVSMTLFQGSRRISELARFIDNSGSFEVSTFPIDRLSPGSNFWIQVIDDQGGFGRSTNFNVDITSSSIEGALPLDRNVSNSISANSELWHKIDDTEDHTTLIFSAEGTLEIEVLNSNTAQLLIDTLRNARSEHVNVRLPHFIHIANLSNIESSYTIERRASRQSFGTGSLLGFGYHSKVGSAPYTWFASWHFRFPEWLETNIAANRQNHGPDWAGFSARAAFIPVKSYFPSGVLSFGAGVEFFSGNWSSDESDDKVTAFPVFLDLSYLIPQGPPDSDDLISAFGFSTKLFYNDGEIGVSAEITTGFMNSKWI